MKEFLLLILLIIAVNFLGGCKNEQWNDNNALPAPGIQTDTNFVRSPSPTELKEAITEKEIDSATKEKVLQAEDFYDDCLTTKNDPTTKTFSLYLKEPEDFGISTSIKPIWKLSTETDPGRLLSTSKLYIKDHTVVAAEFESGPPSGDFMEMRFDCFHDGKLVMIEREINRSYQNEKNEYETLQTIEKAYFDNDIKPFYIEHESSNLDSAFGKTLPPDFYPLTNVYLTTEELLKSFNNQNLIDQINFSTIS